MHPAAEIDDATWRRVFLSSSVPSAILIDGVITSVNPAWEAQGDDAPDDDTLSSTSRPEQLGGYCIVTSPLSDHAELIQLVRPSTEAVERRYTRLLSLLNETLTVVDENLRVKFTTGTLNHALGYSPEFWRAATPVDLVHPDDLPSLLSSWEAVLSAPEASRDNEARMMTSDGSWVEVSGVATNLLHDPDLAGVVLTTRNISGQRQAERLNESQKVVLELIARHGDLDDVLAAIVALIDDNGIGGKSSIFLLDGDQLVRRAGWSDDTIEQWVLGLDRGSKESLCDRAMASGRPVIAADRMSEPIAPEVRETFERLGLRSEWACPVMTPDGSRALGVMTTFCSERREPTDHERNVAEVAATLVAMAVERSETDRRIAYLAHHDDLTGLVNRPVLFERLEAELAKPDADAILILCDLDGFKAVNDSYGHRCGDRVLVELANRLGRLAGPRDLVARLGGDEFVLVVDASDKSHLAQLTEGLATLMDEPVQLRRGTVRVNVSVGVAPVPKGEGATAETWLDHADLEMYREKGRR